MGTRDNSAPNVSVADTFPKFLVQTNLSRPEGQVGPCQKPVDYRRQASRTITTGLAIP